MQIDALFWFWLGEQHDKGEHRVQGYAKELHTKEVHEKEKKLMNYTFRFRPYGVIL